jgi:hypothetical protein
VENKSLIGPKNNIFSMERADPHEAIGTHWHKLTLCQACLDMTLIHVLGLGSQPSRNELLVTVVRGPVRNPTFAELQKTNHSCQTS